MPHAGIEPAAFCLLDRRSAPEPTRQTILFSVAFQTNLTQIAPRIISRNNEVTITEFWLGTVLL